MTDLALPPIFSPEKVVYYHNWLYSVVPVGVRTSVWNSVGTEEVIYPLVPFLTGYCRNCGRAFSKLIPFDTSYYVETPMNVPKEGCLPPG